MRAVIVAAVLALSLSGCTSILCPDDQQPRPSGPYDICPPT
jgi:uncharacterized protein YceK